MKRDLVGFKYCPGTGNIYRSTLPRSGPKRLGVVGHLEDGYIRFMHNYKSFSAHRAAMILSGIDISGKIVDHLNGNRRDNRILNLRVTDTLTNNRNMPCHRAGKLLGVTRYKDGVRFRSQINMGGKVKHLGIFGTEVEAHTAYLCHAQQFFEG